METGREPAGDAAAVVAWIDNQLAAARVLAAERERQEGLRLVRRQMLRTWLGSRAKTTDRRQWHANVRRRLAQWECRVGYFSVEEEDD